ncbi:hypothetical protein NUW54_g7939 [Trametes sanguinea]|uniref:Uncharacterized protein n=1 Tax=Trametes sanguinea TaxID=158606 RepID=A0ACC1PI13_9APHY|nr:hypothetical protein NUW54_g7939 [Trametes sanguinea]
MTEKDKPKASTLPPNSSCPAKKLSKSSIASTQHKPHHARKRRKLDHASTSPDPAASPETTHQAHAESSSFPRGRSLEAEQSAEVMNMADEVKNGESLLQLRKMVLGQIHHSPAHTQPGKYVAIDCEMVGVGIDGEESALARVSLVNFYGAVLLDAFVRPRERVVDYRTQYSGIRPSDMVHAKSFEEVQKQVADLLEDRILVGHAVHNDLKR